VTIRSTFLKRKQSSFRLVFPARTTGLTRIIEAIRSAWPWSARPVNDRAPIARRASPSSTSLSGQRLLCQRAGHSRQPKVVRLMPPIAIGRYPPSSSGPAMKTPSRRDAQDLKPPDTDPLSAWPHCPRRPMGKEDMTSRAFE
jgi:hypothetical protein